MSDAIIKWIYLGFGVFFALAPLMYYGLIYKKPQVTKSIRDTANNNISKRNSYLVKQLSFSAIPALIIFVLFLYLLSWKVALVYLIGYAVVALILKGGAYIDNKVEAQSLLNIENEDKTLKILSLMSSVFIVGMAYTGFLALEIIFNDNFVLLAFAFGIVFEAFLVNIGFDNSKSKTSFILILSVLLSFVSLTFESFSKINNITLVLWAMPLAGLFILLISLPIKWLLSKIELFKKSKLVLPIIFITLSVAIYFIETFFLLKNDQFGLWQLFAPQLIGLLVISLVYFLRPLLIKERIFILVLFLLSVIITVNFFFGFQGIALLLLAQLPVTWALLTDQGNNEFSDTGFLAIFIPLLIFITFMTGKYFNLSSINLNDLNFISSLMLGGLIVFGVLYFSKISTKKTYLNTLAILSVVIPIAIIALAASNYFMVGIVLGVLIIGIYLMCQYLQFSALIFSYFCSIFLILLLNKNIIFQDTAVIYKIILVGVLLILISAYLLFTPNEQN